jgi:hypothetical protein
MKMLEEPFNENNFEQRTGISLKVYVSYLQEQRTILLNGIKKLYVDGRINNEYKEIHMELSNNFNIHFSELLPPT